MKGNVVSFEQEYYLSKEKEAKQAIESKNYKKALEILEEPIAKIDTICEAEVYCPQNVFEQIIFLNLLGKDVHQTSFAKTNYYSFYAMSAIANFYLNNIEKTKEYYEKAIKVNPASCEARNRIMKIDLDRKVYDSFLDNIKDAMFFAYTRDDIGHIFEIAGDYLTQVKDYEMALVAYHLSMVYNLDDSVAKKATESAKIGNIDVNSENWLSEYYMKKFYNKYQIPLMPNDKLVLLADAMGNDAKKNKAYGVAIFSFNIAYNLTLDEKYKRDIEEVKAYVESGRK